MLKNNLVNFLKIHEYDYLLVNSTNEFLVEYNEIELNARYHLTGFSGSTGEALLDKNGKVFLFVDGRYHKQADNQAFDYVEVVKLKLGETFLSAVREKICDNTKIAVVADKISLNFYNNFYSILSEKNIDLITLDFDPVFRFVDIKNTVSSPILDIPIEITGQSVEEKIGAVQSELQSNECLLVTNLEQIAWLLNKRSFAQNFSSCFKSKMLIENETYKVFYENDLADFNSYIKNSLKKFVYVPKNISYGDFLKIKHNAKELLEDKIEQSKAIKNDAEIAHIKNCFLKTDRVVNKIANYVNSAETLTEQELVKFTEKSFFEEGATSLSFNTILASGKNSALAHYSTDMLAKTTIQKGDLVLLDCGAYFEGGYATDITRVFCFGEPSLLTKQVYTTVLKANLNAYHIEIGQNLSGWDIDKKARAIINNAHFDGFNFNHSTGHGVGISVHEFPPSISPSELAKTSLKEGMVFTIEPGMYNPEFGGVRLENTVLYKNGQITSFSKMKFEEKLIDFDMLNAQEQEWLAQWQLEAL